MAKDCKVPQPCRLKYWEECTQDEKIERMRERIHHLESELVEAREMLAFFREHMHSATGEVRVPIPNQQYKAIAPSPKGEVYF
jgi:hypothetical protein